MQIPRQVQRRDALLLKPGLLKQFINCLVLNNKHHSTKHCTPRFEHVMGVGFTCLTQLSHLPTALSCPARAAGLGHALTRATRPLFYICSLCASFFFPSGTGLGYRWCHKLHPRVALELTAARARAQGLVTGREHF